MTSLISIAVVLGIVFTLFGNMLTKHNTIAYVWFMMLNSVFQHELVCLFMRGVLVNMVVYA